MLKERYQEGVRAALEKVGAALPSGGQSAAMVNPFRTTMAKSVDNAAGLTTKATNQAIGPKRARPPIQGAPSGPA